MLVQPFKEMGNPDPPLITLDQPERRMLTASPEEKVIDDLTQMINQYDFAGVINEAQQTQWQPEYKPTVQDLFEKLEETL